MNILFFIIFTATGAALYRLRGAPWLPFLHRPIKQVFYCSGLAIVAYLITGDWLLTSIAGVLSVGATCAGHGSYMNLGHGDTEVEWE